MIQTHNHTSTMLIQVTTDYYKMLQFTTSYHIFLQIATNYYNVLYGIATWLTL